MDISTKTVCATLFILAFSISSFAQISLDKIVYQTPIGLYSELHCYYEEGRLVHMDNFSGKDSIYLSIDYKGDKINSMHCASSLGNNDEFSLSFRYSAHTLDTIFFVDKEWIGLYTLTYLENGFIESIKTFINIGGEYFNSNETRFLYHDNLVKRKEYHINNNEIPSSSEINVDKYFYNAADQLDKIVHYNSSANGYSESHFDFSSDLVLESSSLKSFTGGDELTNQSNYNANYLFQHDLVDIEQPFQVLELLNSINRFSPAANINRFQKYFSSYPIESIKEDTDIKIECHYTGLLTDISEEYSTEKDLIIYPNPVIDYLYFSDKFQAEWVSIFDMNGLLVCKMNYVNTNVNLSNLDSGSYVLHALDKSGESLTLQFVKL